MGYMDPHPIDLPSVGTPNLAVVAVGHYRTQPKVVVSRYEHHLQPSRGRPIKGLEHGLVLWLEPAAEYPPIVKDISQHPQPVGFE